MTMMMTNSQFGLEDMEDLWWSSFPMADAMDFLRDYSDQQELREGGRASPELDTPPVSPLNSLSPSSSSSPPPFYSPPPSPSAVLLHEDKVGTGDDLLSLSSLGSPSQPRQVALDDGKEELLSDLDWMAERMDLALPQSPSSPEDFLASLDCSMDLDSLPLPSLSTLPTPASSQHDITLNPTSPTTTSEPSVIMVEDPKSDIEDALSPPPCVPEPQEELEIKSEPASPDPPSPVLDSPSSSASTLDLGSEVDVSESEVEQVVTSVVPPVQRMVFSSTRLVLVLAPPKESTLSTTTVTSTPEVIHVYAPQKPCRSRPYPEPTAAPPSSSGSSVKVRPTVKSKGRKLKKMEQNKTAATRYRQKKKLEKEGLLEEHTILERKNVELKEKAESMAREIEYLKELMEEVRQTRMKKGLTADP